MGFNGSIGVHIKTGRRHMAEDHFRTLLDPPKGYERSKNPKEPTKLLELSRLQYLQDYETGSWVHIPVQVPRSRSYGSRSQVQVPGPGPRSRVLGPGPRSKVSGPIGPAPERL